MAKAKQIKTIADLTPDRANVNAGTERGTYLVDWSLTELGAGRSILADRSGNVLAGNKTLEAAAAHGFPVRVVESDGKSLVVVQRTDLDLDGNEKERATARQMAFADNRASEVGYAPDVTVLLEHYQSGVDLSAMYRDAEIDALMANLTPDGVDDRKEFNFLESAKGDNEGDAKGREMSDLEAKPVLRFPLGVVVSAQIKREWEIYKQENDLSSDSQAFLHLWQQK